MKVLRLTSDDFEKILKEAVRSLKKGNVLACPTDTVYGFVADATNASAVRKIFRIKGREKGKSIPIFVKDITMARTLAKISKVQEKFIGKVWQGKVTVVLESKNKLPKELGTAKTIGLRQPKYKFLNLLLEAYGKPLTGTSANLSSTPSLSDSKEIIAQFQNRKHKPDTVLDAGVLPKSKPSKVIDITEAKHKVIRK